MAARRALWACGAPARAALVAIIKTYRVVLSGWLGGQCRFAPTCSHYAEQAIHTHGAIKGSALATWRVLRCNPYGKGGIDPVPPAGHPLTYENVTHRREVSREASS
ncbi:MAG TPA: membrane protein insertion efficiency factor YidD [Actinomycetota bacterium]|jgi:putative membrane protein insertion efficiency factor|nr:membrane protein insertion efficiency factor YidD [Actinomycetota bacterium]